MCGKKIAFSYRNATYLFAKIHIFIFLRRNLCVLILRENEYNGNFVRNKSNT